VWELFQCLTTGWNDVDAEEKSHRQEADGWQNRPQLPVEVTICSNADGILYLLHLGSTLVLFKHIAP